MRGRPLVKPIKVNQEIFINPKHRQILNGGKVKVTRIARKMMTKISMRTLNLTRKKKKRNWLNKNEKWRQLVLKEK